MPVNQSAYARGPVTLGHCLPDRGASKNADNRISQQRMGPDAVVRADWVDARWTLHRRFLLGRMDAPASMLTSPHPSTLSIAPHDLAFRVPSSTTGLEFTETRAAMPQEHNGCRGRNCASVAVIEFAGRHVTEGWQDLKPYPRRTSLKPHPTGQSTASKSRYETSI